MSPAPPPSAPPSHVLQAAQLIHAGTRFLAEGDPQRAENTLLEAERIFPEACATWGFLADLKTQACLQIADLLMKREDWPAAMARVNQVLQSQPDHLVALEIRKNCWYRLGCLPEHVADTWRSIELQPDAEKHNGYVFKLNFLAGTTPEALYEESLRWARLYAEPLTTGAASHSNVPDPERRLKIGYVSSDVHEHAIMKLLPAMLEHQDSEHFEVFIYSIETKRDAATDYVQRCVAHFVELRANKHEIADRVRADAIDILVDLGGHTMPVEALLAFALKPAPVQASWMGCIATSGMSAMDYMIGDAHTPCAGTEHLFSERIVRMPRISCCYRPAAEAALAPTPGLRNGYITFGCFNSKTKITREMTKVWSVLLHLNPGSKLLFKSWGFENVAAQQQLRSWFAEDGIDASRVQFEGKSPHAEYFDAWNRVDIALDPFPYNGGTTTMDALWMGVPVVSLTGRAPFSCPGKALLSAVGLPVAQTAEEYVSIACTLAKSMAEKPDKKEQIREAMRASALMDEPGLMRALESGYREMWRGWCATRRDV